MGGTIGFTVREEGGALHVMNRWTNTMSNLFQDVGFINKDPGHLNKYLEAWYEMVNDWADVQSGKISEPRHNMTEVYVPGACFAPCGYGLVFVDYQTNKVIHFQGYTNPTILLVSDLKTQLDESTRGLADAGRLKVEQADIDIRHEWAKEDGKEFTSIFEQHGDKALTWSQILEAIPKHKPEDINLHIDMNPWEFIRYDDTPEGVKQAKLDIEALGVKFTPADKAGWAEYLKYLEDN